MFDFWSYKWFLQSELESYFLDTEAVFLYGINITPIYHFLHPFKRVWGHIIYVEKDLVQKSILFWRYTQEIKQIENLILSRIKEFDWQNYCALIDHKNDQAREVMDYIILNNIKTTIHIYAPDNMFWFFHDMGHWYIAEKCHTFYDNAYWYPEMLINIFAAIKLKQYGVFNKTKILDEVVVKCYRYKKIDKDYFTHILNLLDYSDDI